MYIAVRWTFLLREHTLKVKLRNRHSEVIYCVKAVVNIFESIPRVIRNAHWLQMSSL